MNIFWSIFWLVVCGGRYISAGGGWCWVVVDGDRWWWMVVGGGGWWHSLV